VRGIRALLFVIAAGCSGFVPPTSSDLERMGIAGRTSLSGYTRLRIRMSLDSASLAGEFEGVVLARLGDGGPVIRMQLFGDLGPKVIDLMVRPNHIVGVIPPTREAVDCALPGEATPHPLLFMGATLAEHFSGVTAPRVLGVREEGDRWWLNLKSIVPGMTTQVLYQKSGAVRESRFSWMYGLSWREEWITPEQADIVASKTSFRVRILKEDFGVPANPELLELTLPQDVRIVAGSRK
jgi:hypothetical protein